VLLLFLYGVPALLASYPIHFPEGPRSLKYLAEVFIQLLFFLFVLFGVHLNGNGLRDLLGPRPKNWREVGVTALWGLALACLSIAIAYFISVVFGHFYKNEPPAIGPRNLVELLLFFGLSITTGFWEELTFRGYLLKQIYYFNGNNIVFALLVQAALFTIAHGLNQTAAGVADKMIFGLLLGWVTILRKSLLPAIIAHGVGNALLGAIAFYLK